LRWQAAVFDPMLITLGEREEQMTGEMGRSTLIEKLQEQ